LIKIFESDDFPPHKDYSELKKYYEKLKNTYIDSEEDTLDFLS